MVLIDIKERMNGARIFSAVNPEMTKHKRQILLEEGRVNENDPKYDVVFVLC